MPQSVRQASTLYAQLLNTGLQNKDQPLYQVIYNLINGLLNVQAINTNTTEIISGLVFTPGSIIYAGADGKLTQQNAGLFFDYTNVRLGIGTNTPAQTLVVQQSNNLDALIEIKRAGGVAADWTIGAISGDAGLSLLSSGVSKATLSTAGLFDTTILESTRTALVVTSTDGIVAQNTTPATGGVLVQMSPRVRLSGSAWNGASSDTIDAWMEVLPQSGTTRGQFKIGAARNGASVTYPLILDFNPTTGVGVLNLPGGAGVVSAFRGGDGSVSVPVFGFVNSGGGNSIGFWTPAPNDIDLVCGGANQILWGTGLWRNSSALSMGWSSTTDPNSAIADTLFVRLAAAKIKYYTSESSETAGFVLDFSTDAVAKFRNRADAAYATIDCLGLKASGVAGANATLSGVTAISITVVNGIVTVCTSP